MSNFEFLIADKEPILEYPWLKILYDEAKEVEQDYVAGNRNRLLRSSRAAMEFAIKKYMLESGINAKKQTIVVRHKRKKKEQSDYTNPIILSTKNDYALYERINLICPPGPLLPAAHFIRKEGNEATHNIEYVGSGREYDCLKNLHDFILWIYNELTEAEVISEFSLDNLEQDIRFATREHLQDAVRETTEKRVSQRKKKKRKKKGKLAYQIETDKNEIIIVNDQNQEIFVFKDSEKDDEIINKQLPAVINNMKYMLVEIKNQKDNAIRQLKEYEQQNQYALSEIQTYINQFDLGERNTQTMLEYFVSIQKVQHEGLEEIIRRIEENLRDKEACIQFLEQLSADQNVQIDLLKLRIIHLEKDIEELLEELKHFMRQEKPQLLSEWIQQVKGNFHGESGKQEQERTYTREQFENLYKNFKKEFNRVSFLYESEKLVRQKQEYELIEYEFKLGEQKNVNKKLVDNINEQKAVFGKNRKKQKSWMRVMRYFSLSLLILIIVLILLFLWQRERAHTYQKQYEEVMDMLEHGVINTNPQLETDSISVEKPQKVQEQDSEYEEQPNVETSPEEEVTLEYMDAFYGKIVDGIYYSGEGDYQIKVPDGWDLYAMNNGVYLGTNEEVLESDMFYLNVEPIVSFENNSMNWHTNYWGDDNIFFTDFSYCTYAGYPCIKNYNYVTFEINGVQGGNYLLTYTILADKEYEFNFVDRDNTGDLFFTAEEMMNSLVFIDKEAVEEPTQIMLNNLAGDMLEAYFIRRNYEDTLIHLTSDYKEELGGNLLTMMNSLSGTPEEFVYEIRDMKIYGDTAEAKIYMKWVGLEDNISTMKFVRVGNAWKINYFDK